MSSSVEHPPLARLRRCAAACILLRLLLARYPIPNELIVLKQLTRFDVFIDATIRVRRETIFSNRED